MYRDGFRDCHQSKKVFREDRGREGVRERGDLPDRCSWINNQNCFDWRSETRTPDEREGNWEGLNGKLKHIIICSVERGSLTRPAGRVGYSRFGWMEDGTGREGYLIWFNERTWWKIPPFFGSFSSGLCVLCVVGPFKGESEPKVFLSRYLGDRRMDGRDEQEK